MLCRTFHNLDDYVLDRKPKYLLLKMRDSWLPSALDILSLLNLKMNALGLAYFSNKSFQSIMWFLSF